MNQCQSYCRLIKRMCNQNSSTPLLPLEYQQVEYLQSSTTQYIDTGIYPDPALTFDIDFDVIALSSYGTLMGSDNNEAIGSRRFFFCFLSSGITANIFYCGTSGGDTFTNNYAELNLKTNLKFNNGDLTFSNVNGTLTRTYDPSNLSSTQYYTIYLFGLNRSNSAKDLMSVTIYDAKLKKNNALIRDFVPCYRKSDNKTGMYDLVSRTFFTNAGGGEFIVGPRTGVLPTAYQAVSYLECSGSQYIDTNFYPDGNTGVEVTMSNVSANGVLFGAYNTTWTTGYGMYCNYGSSGNFFYHYYSNTHIQFVPPANFNMIFENGTTTINAVQKASVATKTFTVNYPLYILAGNTAGTLTQPTKCKIYIAKVYDNGTLAREFIPCYRKSDSKPGMYDLVTKSFFINAGTGEFTVGNNI